MPERTADLVALMPFARHIGVTIDEASPGQVIARLAWVRAVAVPLHRGRTTVTVQTSLYDSQDRLVAQTTQVQSVSLP